MSADNPASPSAPVPPDAQAAPNTTPEAPQRSESLLPAEDDPDVRFAVAEEVSLDQQSDSARRVGALPPDPAPGADLPEALAQTLGDAAPGAPLPEERLPPPI